LDIDPEGSILIFDKPYRCTSFDLVNKVKHFIKREMKLKLKVGHAGTLDPLATGVLIVAVGKATKQIPQFQAEEKEYTGTFRVGATTPTFDLEKEIDYTFEYLHITKEIAQQTALRFMGEIEQIPPQFSAVKIDGKRAFDYARSGKEVEIKPKTVTVSEFEITRFDLPDIDFRIVCSKGTYIRSIARDFGAALQSGAHLTALRRTRTGPFRVENAIQLKSI
jgi:tRNA pseudouridine55 synthase